MLLFNYFGSGTQLYLLLMPFLAALAGGSVYADERLSNRLPMLAARTPRPTVAGSSMVSGFVLGGLGGAAPLLTSLVVALIREPHMEFVDGVQHDAVYYPIITSDSWVYGLYRDHQPLLLLLTVLYVFVLCGLLADLAVAVSFHTRHRYVEIMMPFVITYVLWLVLDNTPLPGLHFMRFLDLRMANYPGCVIGAAISLPLLAILLAVLYLLEVRRETR